MKDQNAVALVRKRWMKYTAAERSAWMKLVRKGKPIPKPKPKPTKD